MRCKYFLLIFGVLALAFPASSQAGPVRRIVPKGKTAWKSSDYRFAVWMPSKPTISRDMSSPGGNQPLDTILFQVDTPTLTYGISVMVKPAGVNLLAPPQTKLYLDMLQNKILQAAAGTLLGRQDIRLSNFPGREMKMTQLQGRMMTYSRTYFTSRFVYQITASGHRSHVNDEMTQINRVFDSFRILPQ